MTVRVIIPPAAIVTPADIPGDHGSGDAAVARLISAATRTIDGPSGWLGRALGPQTLEFRGWIGSARFRLPYLPIIDVESVAWRDAKGVDTVLEKDTDWRRDGDDLVFLSGASWVHRYREAVVRYKAGYDGTAITDNGTGPVPDEVKTAVIFMVQHMMLTNRPEAFVSSEEVPDVATIRYSAPDRVEAYVRKTVENLLDGLRVYV